VVNKIRMDHNSMSSMLFIAGLRSQREIGIRRIVLHNADLVLSAFRCL